MNSKRIKQNLLGVAIGLSLSGFASAGPQWSDGLNNIEFNNFENIYRLADDCITGACLASDPTNDPAGYLRVAPTGGAHPSYPNGNLQAGDIFTGIFQVRSIEDALSGANWAFIPGSDEFTGYFAQQVQSITFSESGDVDHVQLGVSTVDPFGVLDVAAGEMFGFWSDDGAGVTDFSSGGSTATDIANATDGEFWAAFGLSAALAISGSDDPLDPSVTDGYIYSHVDLANDLENFGDQTGFGGMNLVTVGGAYNASFLRGINDFSENEQSGSATSPLLGTCTATSADPILCNQLVGNFQLEANQASSVLLGLADNTPGSSPWIFASQDPLQLYSVPEPAGLALFGLGLIGMAGLRRRKLKA